MITPPNQRTGQHPLDVYGDIRRVTQIFQWFISAILLSLIVGVIVNLSVNNILFVTLISAGILLVLAALFLVHYKKFEWASISLAVTLFSLLTILATNGQGIHQISNLAFPAILIVASLVTRKRTMIFLTVYTIGCIGWLVFGELTGAYTPAVFVKSVPGDFFLASFAILLTAFMSRFLTESLFKGNQQLQRELRERKLAEEKYHNIFDNAIDGIFQSTPEGRFISVNPALARMYGYASPEEMIESVTDISSQIYVDSELRNSVRSRLANGEKVSGFESREYRKDGSTFWTSTNAQAIRDANGNVLYYEGTVEDITERKLTEASLRKRESILEAITFSAEQFLKTPDWREKIDIILERLGKEFNASHAYLFEKHPGSNGEMLNSLKYEWTAPGQKPDIQDPKYQNIPVSETGYERYYQILESGEPFLGSASSNTESGDNQIIPSGIKTLLEMWIFVNGKQWGTIGFDDVVNEREWTAMEVDVIKVAANVLGAAIKRQMDEEAIKNELAERKRAEHALILSEEKFSKAFHTTPVMMSIEDENQLFIDVNKAFINNIGYNREDIIGSRAADLGIVFAPEDIEKIQKILEEQDTFRDIELSFRQRSGKIFIVLMSIEKFLVNNLIYTLTSALDITERKQAELEREQLIQELAAKNAESETLRESFAIIVGTFEFSEIIQHILDQIKRVIPYDSASVWKWEDGLQKFISGRNLPPMFAGGNVEFVTDETNAAFLILSGKVPFILNNNVQEELSDFQEEPHTSINSWLAFPLKTRGKIVGLIALDGKKKNQFNEHHTALIVTFANQVAIALENSRLFSELQNELTKREKLIKELESKNTELESFTYTVSHDLRSPLVTINGFLGYLKKDATSGNLERTTTDIQRIQDAVDKMNLLLRKLLELSRIGRIVNPPEKVPFEDLVREALEIVHGRIETSGVTVQTQSNLPAIHGDRQRLVEVLQNLLDNAAKYMGSQTAPHIEIGQHGEDAEDGKLIFYVKDNGMGIAPEYHERVFGLFNKLDAKSEGTGVGLALVKRIIEVHGGRIWVESEAEKGSTFYFTLPKSPEIKSAGVQ